MNNLPAETLRISPEGLEIANCYLQTQDVSTVATTLDIPIDIVAATLAKKDIKDYVNQVFFDVGYNNRFKMREAMDSLITRKMSEMLEADIGSSKDIADLLALSHKMSMDLMDKEIQLEKAKSDKLQTQVNVQVNNDGTKYGALIEKLLGEKLA